MKLIAGVLCGLVAVGTAGAQDAGGRFSTKSAVTVFGLYSNDSSHILLGYGFNRKLAGVGVGYARRLVGNRFAEWDYEGEVRPLNFVRDPTATGQTVIVTHTSTGDTVYVNLFDGPTAGNCKSGTTQVTGTTPGVTYSSTTTQTCQSRWTYAGGMSPLGFRFSFAKRHRLQPFVVANGGFLVTPHDEPGNYTSRFNFTFEAGGGLEWFRDSRRSVTMDFRVHHLSNDYIGYTNPGVDSGVVRVGYRFGR